MAENNVDILRKAYAAFATGDVPAVLSAFTPDIRWTDAEGFPYGGTYVGADEIVNRVFVPMGTEWDGYKVEPREFLPAGDRVVVLGTYSGTYKATGKSFRAEFAHVWRLRNGKVSEFVQYADTALVQRALQR